MNDESDGWVHVACGVLRHEAPGSLVLLLGEDLDVDPVVALIVTTGPAGLFDDAFAKNLALVIRESTARSALIAVSTGGLAELAQLRSLRPALLAEGLGSADLVDVLGVNA